MISIAVDFVCAYIKRITRLKTKPTILQRGREPKSKNDNENGNLPCKMIYATKIIRIV